MKSGQIISFVDDLPGYYWIVLEITSEQYTNSRYLRWTGYVPGFYAFRGFWYGRNPLSHKSFGKMREMRYYSESDFDIVRQDIFCLKNSYLKTVL